MKKLGLLPRLIIGILFGAIFGSIVAVVPDGGLHTFLFFIVRLFNTFNSIFGNFLSFIIPLVIVSLVSVGLADLGKKANKLFGFTLILAYLSSICAGFLAYFVGVMFLPSMLSGATLSADTYQDPSMIIGAPISTDTLQTIVPVTPLFTIEMPVIFGVMTALILSFILGLGLANIKETSLLNTIKDLRTIVIGLLSKVVIPLIPIHISGLFMKIAVEGQLVSTIKLFAVLYLMIILLQLFYILIQFLIASSYTKHDMIASIKNILPAYFTALGTQSSAATIPVSVECAYKNGSDKDVVDFAIPLCATIHLAGDTIALVLGAMGIMIVNGYDVSFSSFLPYILMLGVTMVAAPGIPGGGVMAALGLLGDMLMFTPGMLDLMITLHFSQDSFGTATNVSGDQALCLVINKFNSKHNNSDE